MADGPFAGLMVLDLTRVLAGPFCTMMLAELGARVIKVEYPHGGDDSRQFEPFHEGQSAYFASLNRGKESIALDLKNDGDRAVLWQLVRRADVLVENFCPGTLERLGFGYDKMRAVNPRLIYAAVSGFGQTGPWSRKPAYDVIVQALSGMMSVTGQPGNPPTKAGTSIADITGGLFLLSGIAAGNDALFARLCQAVGRAELVTDRRFSTNRERVNHASELKTALEAALRTDSASHWVDLLTAAGVPCCLIQNVAEAVNHEQTRARNMIVRAGSLEMAGNPIKFGGCPDAPTRRPAPALDADGPRIRSEIGDQGDAPGLPG